MPAAPVPTSLSVAVRRIAARPRPVSVGLLLCALLLALAALLLGSPWTALALIVGLPAAALGYGLELRRLWSTAGRPGR